MSRRKISLKTKSEKTHKKRFRHMLFFTVSSTWLDPRQRAAQQNYVEINNASEVERESERERLNSEMRAAQQSCRGSSHVELTVTKQHMSKTFLCVFSDLVFRLIFLLLIPFSIYYLFFLHFSSYNILASFLVVRKRSARSERPEK